MATSHSYKSPLTAVPAHNLSNLYHLVDDAGCRFAMNSGDVGDGWVLRQPVISRLLFMFPVPLFELLAARLF